jgi:adenosine deaminase
VLNLFQTRERGFYQSLPKVELHRHLEGSLRLNTMIDCIKTYDLDLPQKAEKIKPLVHVLEEDPYTSVNFLSKFKTLRLLYQSPEMIQRITYEAIEDAANDNIRYMELRFTPVALTRIKDFPLGEAMDWVIASVSNTSEKFGVKVSLIATVNRHEDLTLAEEVVKLSIDRKGKGITAIDLTGNEADFPGAEFEGVFKEAKQSGLRITIHAGEWGGPDNIELAIKRLGAERIGHGVRVIEDPRVVDLARERKIIFEVCPTSNYQTGVFPSIEEHSLPKMMQSGLIVTLNTDDPGISQIDLSNEYALACEMFGFEIDTLQDSIISAARGAFVQDGEREKLIDLINKEFGEKKKRVK